jgi:hypothetical protein
VIELFNMKERKKKKRRDLGIETDKE